jgi:hypothetical protein
MHAWCYKQTPARGFRVPPLHRLVGRVGVVTVRGDVRTRVWVRGWLAGVQERMATIAKATQGFVYLVSVTGVTGMKDTMESRVGGLVDMLHSVSDKPVRRCSSHGVMMGG